MRLKSLLFLLLLLAGLISCASAPLAPENDDRDAKLFNNLESKGVIYIYRPKKGYGAVINFPVLVDGKLVANIHNGTYLRLELDPGEHDVWTAGGDSVKRLNHKFKLPVEIQSGKIYFVKQTFKSARTPRLDIVSDKKGMNGVKLCKLIKENGGEAPTLYK